MSNPDALWKRVYNAFKAHRISAEAQTPSVNLNRIAAKCIGIWFDPSNCTVHEEFLSLDDLRQLKRYDEKDDRPHREDSSIVVLVYEGERVVIDGRRRVNKWLKEGSIEPRSALIITPHSASPKPRPSS